MKQDKSIKNNIWIEGLGAGHIPAFVIRGLFHGANIYYDEHRISAAAGKIISIFKKINICGNFYPADLSMSANGADGFNSVQCALEDMDECIESYCARIFPKEPLRIKKTVKCYLSGFLARQFNFVNMVELKLRTGLYGPISYNTLFLIRHPFNSAVRGHYHKRGTVVKEYGVLTCIKFFLIPCCSIMGVLLGKILPSGKLTNIKVIKPSVWVEYSRLDSVDFAFWKTETGREDMDIVFYMDRKDDGALSGTSARLEAQGFGWADMHFIPMVKLSGIKLSDLKVLRGRLFVTTASLPAWAGIFQFQYNLLLLLYTLIFRRFQVKVLIQHQESSWMQAPQAVAVESAGGIMVGFNWSSYFFSSMPTHIFPQHVYFIWGEETRRHMAKIGNHSKHILPSGLWITENRSTPEKLGRLGRNLDFIIALFDGSSSYDSHASSVMAFDFYHRIIKLIKSNKRWGGIIKSKNYNLNGLLELLGRDPVAENLTCLIDEGRIIMLEPTDNPLLASRHAHISACFGLNSAGIISALRGCRAVHWDCSGISRHPFNNYSWENSVYLSLDGFEKAIMRAGGGEKKIGDFSEFRHRFDYFNDSNASFRVRDFIRSFIESVLNTKDVECSLDFSVKRYINRNRIELKNLL